ELASSIPVLHRSERDRRRGETVGYGPEAPARKFQRRNGVLSTPVREEPLADVGVFDLETLRFLDVNDAAVEKYGYSRSEFLSMTLEDIRLQEDAPRLREALRVLKPNDRMIGLWRHRKKDGTTFDVEVLSSEVTILTRRARLALINDVRSEERRVGKDGRHRWWR